MWDPYSTTHLHLIQSQTHFLKTRARSKGDKIWGTEGVCFTYLSTAHINDLRIIDETYLINNYLNKAKLVMISIIKSGVVNINSKQLNIKQSI